ncbi:MAG: Enamidase [Candidatus Binatia bacterium]
MSNKTLAITNLGTIVSGNIEHPLLDGDTILVEDGQIKAVGRHEDLEPEGSEVLIDANGMTGVPGLIDPHVHPMLGDWNPRQSVMGWMEGALQGGVTSMLSQGIVHMEGRPKDALGTKAMAVLTTKIYREYRPGGGLKMLSGAVILEEGLVEKDFEEMAREGVKLIAEIGGCGIYKYDEVKPMMDWARKYKMKVPMHFGGPSYPGSVRFWADEVIQYQPDIVVHLNGGPITAPLIDIDRVLNETDITVEIIHCGNIKASMHAAGRLREEQNLKRLIIGSDTPVGHGAIPLAILKTIVQICPLAGIKGAEGIALATGNTALAYGLQGIGMIQAGYVADILLMDCPRDSAGKDALAAIEYGDVPAIALIICDGRIVALRGRNTPFSYRAVKVRTETGEIKQQDSNVLPSLFR